MDNLQLTEEMTDVLKALPEDWPGNPGKALSIKALSEVTSLPLDRLQPTLMLLEARGLLNHSAGCFRRRPDTQVSSRRALERAQEALDGARGATGPPIAFAGNPDFVEEAQRIRPRDRRAFREVAPTIDVEKDIRRSANLPEER